MKTRQAKLFEASALIAALKRAPRHIQSDTMRAQVSEAAKLLSELHEYKLGKVRDETECAEKADKLRAIGHSAAESLAEMVAALECDYDRLEELRDERKALADEVGTHGQTKKQRAAAVAAVQTWDEDNAEELKELETAAGECASREDAERRIQEDPLSIELTFGSCAPGETPEADGFIILLGTGGPAVRIVGELDEHNEPKRAWIEAQDWWQPWTEYHGDGIEHESLLTYCRCFYFENPS